MAKKVALGLLLLLMTGCATHSLRNPPLPNSGPDVAKGLLPLGNCIVMVDRWFTPSFEQLVADAALVVDAEIGPMIGTRNLARQGGGPDPNLTIEGVDFQVNVRQYLKGTGPDGLTISLPRSEKPAGEERACPYADYVAPAVGSRWVLFLRPSAEMPDLSLPAGYPWQYEVVDEKIVPFHLDGVSSKTPSVLSLRDLAALLKK